MNFNWESYAKMLEQRLVYTIVGYSHPIPETRYSYTPTVKPLNEVKRYYTIKEYSKKYKVSDWFVRQQIKNGGLVANKKGKKFIIEVYE